MNYNVLELFAGSRSIGNAAENLGMNVFSSDINNFEKINYVENILNFDIKKYHSNQQLFGRRRHVLIFLLLQSGIIGTKTIHQKQRKRFWA